MQPHILILGAGITGAALAYRLAARGASVTVVDAGLPAQAATGRSFGWVNASFYLNEAHFHLRHAALAAHLRLRSELSLPPVTQGCLWAEEEGEAFDRAVADLTRLGYPLRLLDRAAIRAAVPALADPPEAALFFPAETATDPAALTHALLAAASARGARLCLGCPARALLDQAGRIIGIRTEAGPVLADHVVLATGVATPTLLHPLGLRLPMLHRPGALVRTQPLPPILPHVLALSGMEVRQEADGSLLTPASLHHQSDAAEELPDPQTLVDGTLSRLSALFPDLPIRAAGITLAERPVPGDGLPALGLLAPGLTLAVMHSGVTLAPHVADLLAEDILTGTENASLAPFHPRRFQ